MNVGWGLGRIGSRDVPLEKGDILVYGKSPWGWCGLYPV